MGTRGVGDFMQDTGTRPGGQNRRRFVSRKPLRLGVATTLAIFFAFVSAVSAVSLLRAAPTPDSAAANVATETVHYDSGGFNIDAFVAKPAGAGKHPAVLVIHDNQGLNDSIREIARQFAAAGFWALAPDFTSRRGGTRTPEQMTQAVGLLAPNLTVQDARSAFTFLQSNPDVDAAAISTVGFGWGGWRTFMLAASVPELHRAVVYCGTTPSQSFDGMRAPVLAHYAQFDFRTTGNALVTEKSMAEAGKEFSYFVYPQSYRGFYFSGPQYKDEAAKLAWNRTLDFLRK
jgi:carboxymethylenebutenolidase